MAVNQWSIDLVYGRLGVTEEGLVSVWCSIWTFGNGSAVWVFGLVSRYGLRWVCNWKLAEQRLLELGLPEKRSSVRLEGFCRRWREKV